MGMSRRAKRLAPACRVVNVHDTSVVVRSFTYYAKEMVMPERETIERAREDKREGKAPTTQAGEFIREEMHHIREGKHGARSAKQAIAIGLSKARRAGVDLPPPAKGKASEKKRGSAELARQQ